MADPEHAGLEIPADVVALAQRSGDLLVAVDERRCVVWASDERLVPGTEFDDLVDSRDLGLVDDLLADSSAGGPLVIRLAGEHSTRGVAVAARRPDGWLVQIRRPNAVIGVPSAGVTGVLRGEQALDELAWLLSATPRTGREIAVVGFDLDRLAEVNARYGTDVGDEVLDVVAARVVAALRSGDLVARLTDDKFLAVLRGVHHLRGSIRVANKIRAAVEDPMTLAAGEIVVTASVGVTLVSLGESVDAVLERADAAVTMAKAVGGNVVRSNPPI